MTDRKPVRNMYSSKHFFIIPNWWTQL